MGYTPFYWYPIDSVHFYDTYVLNIFIHVLHIHRVAEHLRSSSSFWRFVNTRSTPLLWLSSSFFSTPNPSVIYILNIVPISEVQQSVADPYIQLVSLLYGLLYIFLYWYFLDIIYGEKGKFIHVNPRVTSWNGFSLCLRHLSAYYISFCLYRFQHVARYLSVIYYWGTIYILYTRWKESCVLYFSFAAVVFTLTRSRLYWLREHRMLTYDGQHVVNRCPTYYIVCSRLEVAGERYRVNTNPCLLWSGIG